MKKSYRLLMIAAAALAVSCTADRHAEPEAPGTKGNVKFVIKKNFVKAGTTSGKEGFRILRFRKNAADDYVYEQDIPLEGMQSDGTTLSGSLQMAPGDYKFIPTHGLAVPGNYTWPALEGALLRDSVCVAHTGGTLPPVFMLNKSLNEIEPYRVTVDGPAVTVRDTLRRAVSRVDVLFIRADKTGDGYTPKKGGDVFGPEGLAGAVLDFGNANSGMSLGGVKYALARPLHVTHAIEDIPSALVTGTGEKMRVGEPGYVDYDAVAPEDVLRGSALLRGTYLIPNTDEQETVDFSLRLVSGAGSVREIAPQRKLPLSRNKVTLVRVYVLGADVFTPQVVFAYEIDTHWDGVNTVEETIE